MSRNLLWAVENMFENNNWNHCYRPFQGVEHNPKVMYMEIPITGNTFELPLFAADTFSEIVEKERDDNVEAIVVTLNTQEMMSRYKSLERAMADILTENYFHGRLALIEVKQGNEMVPYYGTQGAVFDKDFDPVMMCSCIVERNKENEESKSFYKLSKLILRIDPYAFIHKPTSMERFLNNKLITACLENTFYMPSSNLPGNHLLRISRPTEKFPVKVEIDDCPFTVRPANTPSISTTNKQLLQVAIDHINEILDD